MIFRKEDYSVDEVKPDMEAVISSVCEFAQKIAPAEQAPEIAEIRDNLTVVTFGADRKIKRMVEGELKDLNIHPSIGACKFDDNVKEDIFFSTPGIAVRDTAATHVVAHEVLHAFSSASGINEEGDGYIKTGSKYREFSGDEKIIDRGGDLNEAITDALASRFLGRTGPNPDGAGYAQQVILADLLIGESVENNKFIQDVYFGKSEEFAKDFDKTVKAANIKFADYLGEFNIGGMTPEVLRTFDFAEREKKISLETAKADELLKGAVEYNLRKATSPEEIDKVHAFQQKIIAQYKEGGLATGFIEQSDIKRLEKLSQFTDKMQKQCKSNLVIQKIMENGISLNAER